MTVFPSYFASFWGKKGHADTSHMSSETRPRGKVQAQPRAFVLSSLPVKGPVPNHFPAIASIIRVVSSSSSAFVCVHGFMYREAGRSKRLAKSYDSDAIDRGSLQTGTRGRSYMRRSEIAGSSAPGLEACIDASKEEKGDRARGLTVNGRAERDQGRMGEGNL